MARSSAVPALLLACLTLSVLAGFTSSPAQAEKRVALVVGNGAYVAAPALPNPPNDARAVADGLKATGFHVIETLDADRRGIDAALRAFTEQLSGADVALFFYAGHGLQVGAQNYLVPVDAKLERERDLEFEAVRLDFVLRQMEIDREGKTSIVFLDACRDNPLARNLARSMGTRSTAIGRGLAATATGVGTFIAFATQPGNVALDGSGANSPFTAALTKHMRSSGRNLPATMIEVRKDVIAATEGKQVPWDHSALTGDFYFVPGGTAPAAGSSVAAPAPSGGADLAALQERLRKLEEDAKARTAPAPGAMMTADGIRLAELRARAANLEDMTKDLQKKLFAARAEEGRTSDPTEKSARLKKSMDIQMEWTRRGQDLKKLREEIAALEGGAPKVAAADPGASVPPVTVKAKPAKSSPDFEETDNVRITSADDLLRVFKAPNPIACREACAKEAACVAYQHGKKIGDMGTCELLSSVKARDEDSGWRSGVRRQAAGPDDGLTGGPARKKSGFGVFENVAVWGTPIKSSEADSADSCIVVCRNTQGCVAANYMRLSEQSKPSCVAFSAIQATRPHKLSGTSVYLLRDPR